MNYAGIILRIIGSRKNQELFDKIIGSYFNPQKNNIGHLNDMSHSSPDYY